MAAEADLSLPQLTPRQKIAATVLAEQAARRIVTRQLERQGCKPSRIPYAEVRQMWEAYLDEHRELYAQAALSPIVQELGIEHRRRRPAAQGLLVCKSQVQNGGQCSPSVPLRQIEGLREGRISGSS